MKKIRIAIVYYSSGGHTQQVAEIIEAQLRRRGATVTTVPVAEATGSMEALMDADTIIFGTPTRFGNVAAPFKEFMERTGAFWYRQAWKNKLAAGFTVSSTTSGDKLNTLISLAVFAAQHGMVWIPLGVLPRFINDQQTEGQNRLGSYVGLMTQCDNGPAATQLHPGDELTAELFADHIVGVTTRFTINDQINNTNTTS